MYARYKVDGSKEVGGVWEEYLGRVFNWFFVVFGIMQGFAYVWVLHG